MKGFINIPGELGVTRDARINLTMHSTGGNVWVFAGKDCVAVAKDEGRAMAKAAARLTAARKRRNRARTGKIGAGERRRIARAKWLTERGLD